MKRFQRALVPALFFLFVTCGEDSPDLKGSAFRIDTLAPDLVRVTNDGEGLWTPETAWSLEEDLRLGSLAGDGPAQFSQIAWIQDDSVGRVYVLDYLAQDIRVFTPTGEYLHTIGRRGQGPGELTSAAGLNWGPDGNLWVWGSQRYSLFTPDGEFVTSHPREIRGVIYPWNGGFLSDGRYVDWGLERERDPASNRPTGRHWFRPIVFTPPQAYDSLPPLYFRSRMAGPGQMLRGENNGIVLTQTENGYIWFAHTEEYTLYKRSLEGDTVLITSIPSRPDSVPKSEVDSIMRWRTRQGARLSEQDDLVKERRLVTRILTDRVRYVYVLPQEPGLPEGTAIDVFEESGIYLGRLRLPEAVLTRGPPPYVTSDHLYAVANDEFDVPFVVRWRIIRPDAG